MEFVQNPRSILGIHQFRSSFVSICSFQTLINPDLTKRGDGYTSSYGAPGRGPPPGPPPRRMGRIHRGGGAAPPPMGGGG
ncbi:selenoprotein K-like isoform X2 [Penaeus vannamei]|uniref:selenoprotein K-like isoform X2 n=1 Tax=Penaeus vannamei TaxID=6689 RepID=UPI00387FAE0F